MSLVKSHLGVDVPVEVIHYEAYGRDLLHYIPRTVIEEILAVLWHGEEKHGDEWKTVPAMHHVEHAHCHMNEWAALNSFERESGRHNLAHAIVRLMFALAIEKGANK